MTMHLTLAWSKLEVGGPSKRTTLSSQRKDFDPQTLSRSELVPLSAVPAVPEEKGMKAAS